MTAGDPQVLCWAGRYRREYPRTTTLQAAARAAGFEIVDAWGRNGPLTAARTFLATRHGRATAVVVGYPGYRTLPLVALAARLHGVPVVFDAFVSLYETRVLERDDVPRSSVRAAALRQWERLAWRMSTRVVLDTPQHAEYVARVGGPDHAKATWVPLGPDAAAMAPCGSATDHDLVASYGNFSALHGAPVVAAAARLLGRAGNPVRITLAGDGPQFAETAAAARGTPLDLPGRLPLSDIRALLCRSSVCLGIFGTSEKAGRVVPNKVLDGLALGRPVITRDGPAVRELLAGAPPGLVLVPPGDAQALARAVAELHRLSPQERAQLGRDAQGFVLDRFSPENLGRHLRQVLAGIGVSPAASPASP